MQKFNLKARLSAVALLGSVSMMSAALVPVAAQAEPVQAEAVYYSQAELDRLLAPIALYPDSLLSHVLIAATYPLEVVQAERWVSKNDHLQPQEALARAADEPWDASVKALVGTPEVLKQMSDDLEWTQAVGEAFLAQQEDVLARVQTLRDHAYTAGNLRSNKHVSVEREDKTIVIENVRREVVYVPYYDTRVVYGSWWWNSHPPVFWSRPSLTVSIGSGIYWGISYNVPSHYYYSHFYWPQRYVVINNHYYQAPPKKRRDYWMKGQDAKRWYHNPNHRRGVVYRHRDLQPERPKYYMVNNGQQVVRPTVSSRAMPAKSVATRNVTSFDQRPSKERVIRTLRGKEVKSVPTQRRVTQSNWRDPVVRETSRPKRDAIVRTPTVRESAVRKNNVRQPYMGQQKVNRPTPQSSQRAVPQVKAPQRAVTQPKAPVYKPAQQPRYNRTQTSRPQVGASPRANVPTPAAKPARNGQNRMKDF
ncbi:DUF3300 domain-containing protein [Pseudidiomarina sp.]|uniref:DUF3300 domain-containing protein n=1 Tax=Pseudidiomarina sp. TaxID=2081707 RepID=UPI003A96C5B3